LIVQVKTGGDSDEDSLFDEDDDSEDEESDEGKTLHMIYLARDLTLYMIYLIFEPTVT
jgi:hypothetical protein